MVKCPKCRKKIDHLKGYEQQGYNLEISAYGKANEGEHIYMEDSFHAECPECCEELFTNYDEAVEFLKGE